MNVVIGMRGAAVCSCGRHGYRPTDKMVLEYTPHGPRRIEGDYPQCVKDMLRGGAVAPDASNSAKGGVRA
jgi:hypothetical protein